MRLNPSFVDRLILSVLLNLTLVASLWAQGELTVQIGAPPLPPTPLVRHGDTWRFHKGISAPQSNWQSIMDASLDGTWGSGAGGFGYADNLNETNGLGTILSDMLNRYTTIYMRRTFDVTNAIDPNLNLQLIMDWDDGFVAYLDGAEIKRAVTREPVGIEPAYNTTASASRESSRGNNTPQPVVTYDLGPVGNQLQPGLHVLAILGINQATNSSDLVQIADLSVTGGQGASSSGVFFSLVNSNSVILSGSNTVAGSTRVVVNGDDAAYIPAQGRWSKTQSLAPGINPLFIAALDSTGAVLASTNLNVVAQLSSTNVGGTLGANTVWNSSMGIIHVTSTVVVPPGGTLSIGPGAVFLVSAGASFLATNAAINATGTANNVIYFLPADGTTVWGELAVRGSSGNLLLQHIETIAGHVELFDGAVGTLEDSYFHDYWTASPAIIHTLGLPNHVTLNLRRCHIARYQEVLSQLATNHIEDCLLEYQGYSGDGIDFDAAQPGSYIRRCTVRRGLIFNTDALDMGEYGAEGSHGVLIDSCLLHDFVDKGVSMGVGVEVTVTNTLIYNVDSGISVKDNSIAGIFNSTIANANYGFHNYNKANPASPTGGGHITNSFNNIIWNITNTAIALLNGSTLVADFSDFQATNYPGTGNLNNDPLFVNAAAHDYSVAGNSPTIGAGLNGANLGVTFPVGGIPGAPFDLAALSTGTNPVTLVWGDDADNEDAFVIERSPDATTWQTVATVGPNFTNYTDNGAGSGQKYYYRLRATNSSGDSPYSNITGGTRQAPASDVGGTISGNTTWYAGVHYIVTNSVTVSAGVTLTIEPGAVVCFNDSQGLTVANGGRLLAVGTTNAPILFTRAPGATAWRNVIINGAAGSPETRIASAHFEFNGSSPCLQVSAGTVFFDHLTFGNTAASCLHVDSASFIIQNCVFPSATTQFELVHGNGGIKSGGHGIFLRNFFGVPIGYNDVVDFTGGNRPGPIIHFLDNVFIGASDDILDLDGTDAWIEGNIFLHSHKNGSPDSSSAVSGSDDSGNTSEITMIGNIIFDCDHAVMGKGGNFYTLINNTIVRQSHQGGTDADGAVLCLADSGFAEAAGMYVEGNIIYDAEKLVRFYTNSIVTFTNNLMPLTWSGPGGENSTADPMLKHVPQLSETVFTNWDQAQIMKDWFSLLTNSPAIGTGPNGHDKGGVVPLGASISGEPNGTTLQTNATLLVGINRTGNGIPAAGWPNGSGYTDYKWRLDSGAWSAETPISTPISLAGLTDGAHYVEVIGKRDSGLYQDDAMFEAEALVTRSLTWTVSVGSVDSDGDGLPDSWELAHGLNPNDPTDADQDTDGDGLTNRLEYIAGTDPQNSASTLRFDTVQTLINDFQLAFTAVSNQTYTVQYRDSFATGSWLPLTNITAQSSTTRLEVHDPGAGASATRFYRLVTPASLP